MNEYLKILGTVLPLFLIMGAGAWMRRKFILTTEADRSLLDLNVNLLVPCLILDHVVANESLRQSGNLWWSPLLGFIVTTGCIVVAELAARLSGLRDLIQVRTFAFVCGIYNYGYIPVPLMDVLYGPKAVAVLFLFNLGTEMSFWMVGFARLQGHSLLEDWRRVLTVPVRALILGVTLNLITAHYGVILDTATLESMRWGWPVEVLGTTIHALGQCSIPLALMLIGATMADFWGDFYPPRGFGIMGLSVLIRNGICPAGFLVLAMVLPVSRELKETLVVQAAMPAGVLPLLLSRHHGGHVPIALQVIFSTSAAALITLPLWLHFGLKLVGLEP